MDHKDNIKKEIESIAPILANLKDRGEEIKIPRNYFSNLQKTVLDDIREKEAKEPEHATRPAWIQRGIILLEDLISPRNLWVPGLVVTLIAAGILVWHFSNPARNYATIQDISEEEAFLYVQLNLVDFDDELIIEKGFTEADYLPFGEDDLKTHEIELYLDENLDEIDMRTLENLF